MVRVDGRSPERAFGSAAGAGLEHLKFAVEPFRPDAIPAWMLQDHYEEVGSQKRVATRPILDIDRYMRKQAKGKFLFITVRNNEDDGELVGYMSLFLGPHPHYKNVWAASDDAHYLVPRLRGAGVGSAMINFAVEEARKKGCKLMFVRDKEGHRHETMWAKLAFEKTDVVYVRMIDDPPHEMG